MLTIYLSFMEMSESLTYTNLRRAARPIHNNLSPLSLSLPGQEHAGLFSNKYEQQ